MTAIFGIPDITIGNEITACPVQGAVCSTGDYRNMTVTSVYVT
jgi:hypothetical protein